MKGGISIKDVQKCEDIRGIDIQNVGVNEVKLPFLIKKKEGGFQHVLANICFTVALPRKYKGTHMSRFLEILNPWRDKPIAEGEIELILKEAITKLVAKSAEITIKFTYFLAKKAPISQKESYLDVECVFHGKFNQELKMPFAFTLGVQIPFTSLCPCSKEISDYGAHNQRGKMTVNVRFFEPSACIWIEDLVAILEHEVSCPIYPLLKREDEKFVTEKAYDNPKFVEDILRDVILALRSLKGLEYFSVICENFESIHNHNAYASHAEYIGETHETTDCKCR